MVFMSSDYEMWITWDNEESKLPIRPLPEKITIDYGASHQTVSIAELGKLAIPNESELTSVKFSSFFPKHGFTAISEKDIRNPNVYMSMLRTLVNNKQPVHFICTGCNINFFAYMKINFHEIGGDVGTKYYNIELIQHKKVSVRQIKLTQDNNVQVTTAGNRVNNSTEYETYTVKSGDYLIKIAREKLGDSSRYKEIAALNSDLIKDPNVIKVGWVLKIPKK